MPAFRSPGVRRAGWAIAVVVLAADRLSKSLVLAAHPGPGNGPISVRLVRNTGASFGLGAGHPVAVLLASLVVIAVVAVLMTRTPSRGGALLLALVAGGALANHAMTMLGARDRAQLVALAYQAGLETKHSAGRGT
jgi:signal peptidase II